MLIGNRYPYNILHVVLAFLINYFVFEGTTMEMQLHCSFVLSLLPQLNEYIKIRLENFNLII